MLLFPGYSWLKLFPGYKVVTVLYTRHGALTHSVREVSRDRMFPLPHAPNQLPNQLLYETPAVLATRQIFAPAQLVQK